MQQLWCFLPAGSARGDVCLQTWHPAGSGEQLVTPSSPRALGWCSSTQQSPASLWLTAKARGAVLPHGRSTEGYPPREQAGPHGHCRGWNWNWHQTHRVLFVNVDLRLQDGHGRALLHSLAHTRPEVGPCDVGALVLQRTPATNRGTAHGWWVLKTGDKKCWIPCEGSSWENLVSVSCSFIHAVKP